MIIASWSKVLFVALSLGFLFAPGVQHHWEVAHKPFFVPFDAVQYIPPFFKFDRNESIPTNYIKEYYLDIACPPLYKMLFSIGARLGDVRRFQLGMMYLAYAGFICILGRLGWLLGGTALSFAVVAFTLTAWIFFSFGFIGGAPRMYAYPMMSLVLYALIRDRPHLLALTVVLGGLLYPIAALIAGLCLASWLLLKPLYRHGVVSRWGQSRQWLTVGLTGVLTIAALAPLLLGNERYGRRITEVDIAIYPEVGPSGNFRSFDRLPYPLFGNEWISYYLGPLYSHGDPIVSALNVHRVLDSVTLMYVLAVTGVIILGVILAGIRLLLREEHRGAGIRLISFFVVCAALHFIAWLVTPYLYIPTRYFMFSLPFLITLIFPWSVYTLLRRIPQLQSSPKLSNTVFLLAVSLYLIAFGGRGNVDFSSTTEYSVDQSAQPLFHAIAGLPKNVLIAGWPLGEIRKVEYVTRRNIFLSGDLHQPLHLNFVKTMRARMNALFDAYLSTDATALYRLRQEFGVTHLLVEEQHFTDPEHLPEYFAPWRARIHPRLAEIKGKEYLMNRSLHERAAIFNHNGHILLDLTKLP
jgi:hypothetical protein